MSIAPPVSAVRVAPPLHADHVRHASGADAAALSEFATRTFIETYAEYPDPDNLHRYATEVFAPDRQAHELADPCATTLLAYRDGGLCGFAQLRTGTAPPCVPSRGAIELHRLYVERRWHGAGVGPELLAQVQRVALAAGGSMLWLKVWERNARAIAFYRKSGFADVGMADFLVREDCLTDRLMAMRLQAA